LEHHASNRREAASLPAVCRRWARPRALVAALALTVTAALGFCPLVAAQVPVFADAFEVDDVCAWDFVTGDHPYCEQCVGRPEGASCGELVVSGCGSCDYSSACDEEATQSCTCTTYTCTAGFCQTGMVACTLPCLRVTDGEPCEVQACGFPPNTFRDLCCNTSGACNVVCSPCQ
jgi:hypothetical protein